MFLGHKNTIDSSCPFTGKSYKICEKCFKVSVVN